jgi:RsiW-degrading membrane proteinase PrsW (M82 family)
MAQQVGAQHFGSFTVPGQVRALGPMAALAGVGEESAKLVPLAVLALVAAGRVRRFAVTDWLLLGFVSGLGFQAFEELTRRVTAHVTRPGAAGSVVR